MTSWSSGGVILTRALRAAAREITIDRKHRLPRRWSNGELRRIGRHLGGDVVNVSAWKDEDKEGGHYRDYFPAAKSYRTTNYVAEARGWQGREGEIFLDLEAPLDPKLKGGFDVVFNHTTLEHVFEFVRAFDNLCEMSRDAVVIVVPFLQPMHADYGDFWRCSPLALKRLFERNGMEIVYCSHNEHWLTAVYLFAVAARQPERWRPLFGNEFNIHTSSPVDGLDSFVGAHAIPNLGFGLARALSSIFRR